MKTAPPHPKRRDTAKEEAFLSKGFKDTLRWLFVAAIAWQAAPKRNRCPHLKVMAMYTALERSGTLYEFFYTTGRYEEDARALNFVGDWPFDKQSDSYLRYEKYMGYESPINKRISHLVWERDNHSGGVLEDKSDHLKNQVLPCALDLMPITEQFITRVTPEPVRNAARCALQDALAEASSMAKEYGVDDRFASGNA
jgi:hypothetical protein